jgi:hypothetical protein
VKREFLFHFHGQKLFPLKNYFLFNGWVRQFEIVFVWTEYNILHSGWGDEKKNTGMKSKWTMCSLTLRFFYFISLSFFLLIQHHMNTYIFSEGMRMMFMFTCLLACLSVAFINSYTPTWTLCTCLLMSDFFPFSLLLHQQQKKEEKTNKKCVKMCEKLFFARSKMMLQFNLFQINIAWLIVSILIFLPLSSCLLLEELSPGEWKI